MIVFVAHKLGVHILRRRHGGSPTPMVTDDFGNLVPFNGDQFNRSAYGWRDLH